VPVSKDSSKQILSELKKLRKELGGRLDSLESRMDKLVPPVSGGARNSASSAKVSKKATPAVLSNGNPDTTSVAGPGRAVTVRVQPLNDLSLARVVESALADTEGVESANLRELRGDSAVIDARVKDGVPLISSLRRRLPVAFDVTDSDRGSFTIALAQPESERTGGVATPEIQ
jgi:hypothetical protein